MSLDVGVREFKNLCKSKIPLTTEIVTSLPFLYTFDPDVEKYGKPGPCKQRTLTLIYVKSD